MSVEAVLHLVPAVVALAALGRLLLVRGTPAPTDHLPAVAAGTVVWSLSIAVYYAEGDDRRWHAVLWLPSIAFTATALLFWALAFTTQGWRPGRRARTAWLAVPAVMLAVRLGGDDTLFPLFVFNTVYCFTVLLAAAAVLARRLHDPDAGVRLLVRGMIAVAVLVLATVSLRLNITDLISAAVVTVLASTLPRLGEAARPQPDAQALLDDLGALLFVFDDEQRLADLNAPARLFFSLRGEEPPTRGTPAAALVGTELDRIDVLEVRLGAAATPFTGYVQRLPASGTPPRGWLCLLRRTARPPDPRAARRDRRTLMSRLPSYEPATGLPTRRSLDQALVEAAALPGAGAVDVGVAVVLPDRSGHGPAVDVLVDAWSGATDTVVLGHLDGRHLALVVQGTTGIALASWAAGHLGPESDVRVATGTLADAREHLADLRSALG